MKVLVGILCVVTLNKLPRFKPLKDIFVANLRVLLGLGSSELQAFLATLVMPSDVLFNVRPGYLILCLQNHLGITAMGDVEIFQHPGSQTLRNKDL